MKALCLFSLFIAFCANVMASIPSDEFDSRNWPIHGFGQSSLRQMIVQEKEIFLEYDIDLERIREYALKPEISNDHLGPVPSYTFEGNRVAEVHANTHRKSLFGIYPRNSLRTTSTFPERAIGHLGDQCTGTLIGPRHVLTAAHCVYDSQNQRLFRMLEFVPGKLGVQEPFGSFTPAKIYLPKSYLSKPTTESDFAVIVLREDIGHELGWLGYQVTEQREYNIQMIGYPDDKVFGTPWKTSCPVSSLTGSFVHHCDTTSGMSGSALLHEAQGSPSIIGIHTHGGADYNGGKRIDYDMHRFLSTWKTFEVMSASHQYLTEYTNSSAGQVRVEFKNLCSSTVRYRVMMDNENSFLPMMGAWTYISPGQTVIAYDKAPDVFQYALESFDRFPVNLIPAHETMSCLLDRGNGMRNICFKEERLDELDLHCKDTYRIEIRCDGGVNIPYSFAI